MSSKYEPFDWDRVVYALTIIGLSAFAWSQFQPSDPQSWIIWIGSTIFSLLVFLPDLFPDQLHRWKQYDDYLINRTFMSWRLFMVLLAIAAFSTAALGVTLVELFRP